MFVDSHCHLDFPELRDDLPQVLDAMRDQGVTHALCIAVEMDKWPVVHAIARAHPNLYASVGVHPDYADIEEPTEAVLVEHCRDPKVVAVGETGLDYYRLTGDLGWQRERFRTHIRAARAARKPLVGGVMHCFTETWDVAAQALELGFHISFSGIVTFKNAVALKDVARRVPLDRMLIETDSPYLAPVPHRGKRNQPAFVRHVAEEIARLREVPVEVIADATSKNFFSLFGVAPHAH